MEESVCIGFYIMEESVYWLLMEESVCIGFYIMEESVCIGF